MPRTTQEYHHQDAPGADAGAAVLDGLLREFVYPRPVDLPRFDFLSDVDLLHDELASWALPWDRAAETAARAVSAAYLEREANVHSFATTCADVGRWPVAGLCSGHHVTVHGQPCGREWCAICGEKGSDAHMRRVGRWQGKALQIQSMGLFVGTVPPAKRREWRVLVDVDPSGELLRAELGRVTTAFGRSLTAQGFDRELLRWHWYGDDPPAGTVPVWHPHLNVLTDSGQLTPAQLGAIKAAWRHALKLECVCGHRGTIGCRCVDLHYSYQTTARRKQHRLAYVTRATFRNLDWDRALARALFGFRNCRTRGRSKKVDGRSVWIGKAGEPLPVLWRPPVGEDTPSAALMAVVASRCPVCSEPVTWQKSLSRAHFDVSGPAWRDHGNHIFSADVARVAVQDGPDWLPMLERAFPAGIEIQNG